MPEGAEILDTYGTEYEAKSAAHFLIHMLGGVPTGWAMCIIGEGDQWHIIRYPIP